MRGAAVRGSPVFGCGWPCRPRRVRPLTSACRIHTTTRPTSPRSSSRPDASRSTRPSAVRESLSSRGRPACRVRRTSLRSRAPWTGWRSSPRLGLRVTCAAGNEARQEEPPLAASLRHGGSLSLARYGCCFDSPRDAWSRLPSLPCRTVPTQVPSIAKRTSAVSSDLTARTSGVESLRAPFRPASCGKDPPRATVSGCA